MQNVCQLNGRYIHKKPIHSHVLYPSHRTKANSAPNNNHWFFSSVFAAYICNCNFEHRWVCARFFSLYLYLSGFYFDIVLRYCTLSLCVCECVQIIWRKCNTKVHLTIYIWIDKSLSNPSTIADVLLIHYWKNNVEISQSENMQRKLFGLF